MSNIKAIRERLGVTQTELGEGMGCTQGNVGHYERGQTVPPDAAKRLIAYANKLGHVVTYEEIYGPAEKPKRAGKTAEHPTSNGKPKKLKPKKTRREGPRSLDNHPGQRADDKPKARAA